MYLKNLELFVFYNNSKAYKIDTTSLTIMSLTVSLM